MLQAWPAVMAAFALLAAGTSAAAADVRFGPRFSVSDGADLGLGADVRWRFLPEDPRLALSLSFDYFFPEDGDEQVDDFLRQFEGILGGIEVPFDLSSGSDLKYWEANLNLTWDFTREATVVPYAGVGVNYARAKATVLGFESEDSDVGANVLAGLRFARRFYVEAKQEAGGGDLFVVTAGVRF